MLCFHTLNTLNHFEQGAQHFQIAVGSTNYLAGPDYRRYWRGKIINQTGIATLRNLSYSPILVASHLSPVALSLAYPQENCWQYRCGPEAKGHRVCVAQQCPGWSGGKVPSPGLEGQ